MENFTGTIIEESLEDTSVLNDVKITSTRVEQVTGKHQTPWIKQWTLHKVEIAADKAENIAYEISRSLDSNHLHSWFADFYNEHIHYYIFRDKVFKIDRKNIEEYKEAEQYGLALGIPSYQINFTKYIKA